MIQNCTQLEGHLEKRLFSNRDLALISMMLGENLGKEEAACLTENVDIDTESSLYLLSLGILGFRFGWDAFPSWAIPRLKGLHRYYQVSSSAGAPWLQARLEILSAAGIPVTLTGGLAMRAFYATDVPRLTYGYEITVPSEDYDKALSLLRDSVREATSDFHDRTVKGHTKITLRKGVPIGGLFKEKEFWEQARTVEFMGQSVLVPCPEDMALRLLCAYHGLGLVREQREERDRRLYEAGFVLQAGKVDFKVLAEKARACGQESLAHYFLHVISKHASKVFSEVKWAPYFPVDKSYVSFLRNTIRLDEIIEQRDLRKKASLWNTFLMVYTRYQLARPARKARRERK